MMIMGLMNVNDDDDDDGNDNDEDDDGNGESCSSQRISAVYIKTVWFTVTVILTHQGHKKIQTFNMLNFKLFFTFWNLL